MNISEPLRLEDQCLLHLICYLEEYLPEMLASLPLHLRHRLLLNLPAADICQLENTPVSAGIDMADNVWKILAQKRVRWRSLQYLKGCMCVLMSAVCAKIVSGDIDEAKVLLFSAKGCLGVLNWDGFQHNFAPLGPHSHFRYPTPGRHMRHFSKDCQQVYLMSCLVDMYQWLPMELSVDRVYYEGSLLWENRHDVTTSMLMRKFLSQLQALELARANRTTTEYILNQIFSNPQASFTQIKLLFTDGDTMAAIAMFFGLAANNSGHLSDLPYRGLTAIEISIGIHSQTLEQHLRSLIDYQKGCLQSVDLWGECTLSFHLMSALSSLFYQPQFHELRLGEFRIPLEHLRVLASDFLHAPSEDHEKVLCLDSVEFSGSQASVSSELSWHVENATRSPTSTLPHKALILNLRMFQIPPNLFNCLVAHKYTSLLSSLSVRGYLCRLSPSEKIFQRRTMLRHLKFTLLSFKDEPSPDEFFTNLFKSPHLKSVHFEQCALGRDGLIPALTRGLQQQVIVASIDRLILLDNGLTISLESELQEFFDVVFSLPQLSDLCLNLRYNDLKPRHCFMMHNSWRKSASPLQKRLKILEITDGAHSSSDSHDHYLQLQDIAVNGDFLMSDYHSQF